MLASRRIYWPAINLIGPGCVAEVGAEVAKLGLRKALVVTDPVLAAAGVPTFAPKWRKPLVSLNTAKTIGTTKGASRSA